VTGVGPDDSPTVASPMATSDATATLAVDPAAKPSVVAPAPDTPDGPDGKAPKEKPSGGKRPPWRVALEWVVLIAVALAIAFIIKSFLFQAFYIPSGSMKPTLNVGDRVLVNKLSYDFHDVNRGDIVVFETPERARSEGIEDFVKRVVGLPGETVRSDADGTVTVDGRRLTEPYLPKGTVSRFTNVPPDCGAPTDGRPGCVVPEGKIFMMGDNREDSQDSRVFGPIDEDTIVGRVFVRIWPLSDIGFL
jgi:signal peptidase I